VIAAKAKIAEQQPLVEAYERLAASEGSLNITEAAKALGKQPKELTLHILMS
jgi:phage antirepressor YoqD-like protein